MQIRIASWNIAGGRKEKVPGSFEYEDHEDLPYFANELKKVDPDVICLQECHTGNARSTAQELSRLLDFPHVFNAPASASHIDSNYELGIAILSKFPFDATETKFFPQPQFDSANSRGLKPHEKNIQFVRIGNLTIANTQMLPVQVFGYEYDSGPGMELAHQMEAVLMDISDPVIFAGDFNHDWPAKIYPNTFIKYRLTEALPDAPTQYNGSRHDHILYSQELRVVESRLCKTSTDHFLCFADFELP